MTIVNVGYRATNYWVVSAGALRLLVDLLARNGPCDYTVITMTTKARIVRIGNSRGIRVPKPLLDQAQLPEDVELYAEPGRIVVRAARGPRYGWAEAAQAMRARDADGLLDEPTATTFDVEGWTW